MLTVTNEAHDKFLEYFQGQNPKPVRVYWAEGG